MSTCNNSTKQFKIYSPEVLWHGGGNENGKVSKI